MPDYEAMFFELVRQVEVAKEVLAKALKQSKNTFMDAYLEEELGKGEK